MSSRLVAGLAGALLCALVAGCGGASKPRLTPNQYRAQLVVVARNAVKAQADVAAGLRAKSVAELRSRLTRFADAEKKLGDEVAALKPPKNAEAANATLASGEHHAADAIGSLVSKLSGATSVPAALGIVGKDQGNAKAGREVGRAVATLRKLGYTPGS